MVRGALVTFIAFCVAGVAAAAADRPSSAPRLVAAACAAAEDRSPPGLALVQTGVKPLLLREEVPAGGADRAALRSPSWPKASLELAERLAAPGTEKPGGGKSTEDETYDIFDGDILRNDTAGEGAKDVNSSVGTSGQKATIPNPLVEHREIQKGKAASQVHRMAEQGVMPATFIMLMAFLFGGMVARNRYTKFIPETLVTVIVAILLGLFIRKLLSTGWITFEGFTVVDATILNLFLLPIIIFQGGWAVNIPYFFDQAPYVAIFAILGTLLSAFLIGYGSWLMAITWGLHPLTDLRTNLAFASLICATDPVATLATFAQLRIADRQPLLFTLVFGESMLNDAIAIILFNGINDADEQEWNGYEVPLAARMAILLIGSIFMGCFLASFLILLLRWANLPGNTVPEMLYVLLAPFFVFSTTEAFELSGIIAVLFAGIVFKLYGAQHLTPEGERETSNLLHTVGQLADSGVFVICGTSAALLLTLEGLKYGILALGICLVARALSITVCTPLCNTLKKYGNRKETEMVSWRHGVIIWLSGLRGGIGLVLALEIDVKWCGAENKTIIINAVFFMICALLFLCGATTEPALKHLGLSDPAARSSAPVVTTMEEVQWISAQQVHAMFQRVLVGEVSKKADGSSEAPPIKGKT